MDEQHEAPADEPRAQEPEAPAPEHRPYDAWAREFDTPAWLVAAAKAGNGWGVGRELTAEQFNEAMSRAASVAMR